MDADLDVLPYVVPLSSQKPRNLTLVPSEPDSRYKCRQLQIQVVGKSKMIRTHLVNVLDVSKDMLIPPTYIGTFMAYSCGAQHKFDPKKPEREQAFLSGEHDPKDLSRIMAQFINEVIACPVCRLPEINFYVDKKNVMATCRSCGETSKMNFSSEKFKRYIINHPPQQKGNAFQGNKEAAKKEKKSKKKSNTSGGEDSESSDKGKPKKEKKSPKSSSGKEANSDNVVWFSDTSEEAAKKRMEAMVPESFTKLNEREDLNEVARLLKEGKSAKELASFKKDKGLTDQDFIRVVFFELFKEDLKKELEHQKEKLLSFTKTYEAQSSLMECIAEFCDSHDGTTQLPFIFKQFYDEDLLEEENICRWHCAETSDEIFVKAKSTINPFVEWLKSADEESEEEDDDEDDDEEN